MFACNINSMVHEQVQAVPAGLDNLVLVSQEIKQKTFATANQGGGGVDSSGKKWKIGEMEFEAQMRLLDNAVSCSRKFLSKKTIIITRKNFYWYIVIASSYII